MFAAGLTPDTGFFDGFAVAYAVNNEAFGPLFAAFAGLACRNN